jgi:hypothetical protein
MLFQFTDSNLDIVFNQNDIVLQFNYNNKIYQDVFSLENISLQHPFFNDIKIVEKFLLNCLNKKTNYECNYVCNKTVIFTFTHLYELQNLTLKFELYHIRQDISSNQEIITLKKKVNDLQIKLNKYSFLDNFYFDSNIIEPVSLLDDNTICFSDNNMNYIALNMFYKIKHVNNNTCEGYILNIINQENILLLDYSNIHFATKLLNNIQANMYYINTTSSLINFINKIDINVLNNITKEYTVNSEIKNYRILDKSNNFMNENFMELKNKCIIFCNLDFTKNIDQLLFLPKTIQRLVFVDCKIDKLILCNSFKQLNSIEFYGCKVTNIDNLAKNNIKQKFTVTLFFTPITPLNKSLFSSNFNFIEEQ